MDLFFLTHYDLLSICLALMALRQMLGETSGVFFKPIVGCEAARLAPTAWDS